MNAQWPEVFRCLGRSWSWSGALVLSLTIPSLSVAGDQDGIFEGQDIFEWMQSEYEEEFIESASKRRQKLSEAPAHVTVITAEQIERSGAIDATEILRLVPNLHVQRAWQLGTSLTPRGFSGYYLVLLDGVEVNQVANLTPRLSSILLSDDIERIEFVHGPASTMYGANAYSGVLSITTKRATEPGVVTWAKLAGGEWDQMLMNTGVRGKNGAWDYTVAGSFASGRTHSPYARPDSSALFGRWSIGYEFAVDHTLAFRGSAEQGANQSAGFTIPSYETFDLALEYQNGNYKVLSFWRQDALDINLAAAQGYLVDSPYEPSIGAIIRVPSFVVKGSVWDTEVMYASQMADSVFLSLGLNHRVKFNERFLLEDPSVSLPYAGGEEEWRSGAFTTVDWNLLESLILSAGVRLGINNTKQNILNPRLSAIFRFGPGHTLRLTFQQAFRKPSAEQYGQRIGLQPIMSGPARNYGQAIINSNALGEEIESWEEALLANQDNFSNPDLESQKAYTLELGYRLELLDASLRLGLDGYYDFHRDIIGVPSLEQRLEECEAQPDIFEYDGNCIFGKPTNMDAPIDSLGVVASVTYLPKHWSDWLIQGSISLRKVAFSTQRWPWGGEDNSVVQAQRESGERPDDDGGYGWVDAEVAPPTWLANASLMRSPSSGLQLGFHGYYASAYDDRVDGLRVSPGADSVPIRIQPLVLVNLHLGYKFQLASDGWLEIGVGIQNLLDTNEREGPGGVQSGLFADEQRRDPYEFDPPRPAVDVAFGGERQRRAVMGMIRGAY